MPVSKPAAALLAPLALALLATSRCAAPQSPSPREPVATASGPADAAPPAWEMPSMPAADRRTILLVVRPPEAPEAGALRAIAADPPALVEQGQWVYDLRYDRGEVYLVGVRPIRLAAPQATPRVMGRFALELYSGKALVERVRFDFPGLGGAERDAGSARALHGASPSFTAKLSTRVGVMLPATAVGTRLELWDRATDRRWPLPWPAVEMTPAAESAPDAGAP